MSGPVVAIGENRRRGAAKGKHNGERQPRKLIFILARWAFLAMRSKPECAFSRRYPALYLVRAIFVRLGDLAMLTSVLRISLWVLTPKWPCSCRPTSRSRYLRESASAPDPQPKTLARGHAHNGGSENRTRTRQTQQSGTSIKWSRLLPCEPEIRKPHSCLPTRPSKCPGLGEDGAVGTAAMAPRRKRQCRFPAPPSDS
jgi:hypothetical protein